MANVLLLQLGILILFVLAVFELFAKGKEDEY